MSKPVTLQDVAERANVSRQTVSRVVNERPDVSPMTRSRVLEVVQELGYRPNHSARSLVSKRSNTLGLISLALDEFRLQVVLALEKATRPRGFGCLLSFSSSDPNELPNLIADNIARQVDGIVLLAPALSTERLCVDAPVPVISLAYPIQGERTINIDVDNVDGAHQAVRHLIDLGHRQIGVVAGPRGWTASTDRVEGGRRALAEAGQDQVQSWTGLAESWSLDGGYVAARQLLDDHPEISALFCHNDWMALGAYRAVQERGKSIPQDVSVVGYDDAPICRYSVPSLTSVRQPCAALGQLIAQLIIDAIEQETAISQAMLLRTELIRRESSAQ